MIENTILLVEDDASLLTIITHYLEKNNYAVLAFQDAREAIRRIPALDFAAALVDVNLDTLSGYDVLSVIKQHHPLVEVIFMTAYASVGDAVQAMQAGAMDYLTKPVQEADLILHLHTALKKRDLALENNSLKNKLSRLDHSSELLGDSPVMVELRNTIESVAQSEVSVLIQGESGTGKELAARMIHRKSSRSQGPFVAINCAAIPENLLESELFGYTRGAFSGALEDREGKLVQAQGGTLFLDEVTELPLPLQAKLLRVVQEKEVTPLGSHRSLKVNVRFISASNRDVSGLIEQEMFRSDLYYRLNAYPLFLPPLREHRSDLPVLMGRLAPGLKLTDAAMQVLNTYSWPGNVRELENGLEYARINAGNDTVKPHHLPPSWSESAVQTAPTQDSAQDSIPTLAQVERELIIRLLNQNQGNQTLTARMLDISRSQLLYRMKKFHIHYRKTAE